MADWENAPGEPGMVDDVRGQQPVEGPFPAHPSSPRAGWMGRMMNRAEGGMPDADSPLGQMVADTASALEGEQPLRNLLTSIYSKLSDTIAGGTRTDHRDMLPGQQDPLEGIIPDEFLPDVQTVDWFDPTVWAQATAEDMNLVDLASITAATGPGKDGKGLDWFRGGQAPNNYANRHNPLYQARRDFAINIAPQIEEMFGVSAQGSAGYMRQPSAGDAAPGGRAANSDHQSGGAIDFFGTKEEMVALRNWATEQPWVSFVRCQSESHYDHVHISIDVGWIAQNYFQGRSIPPITQNAPRSPELPSTASNARSTVVPAPAGGRPI